LRQPIFNYFEYIMDEFLCDIIEQSNYIELIKSEQSFLIKLLMDSESQAEQEYKLLLKLMVIYEMGAK
jgi:hypothetical protein